MFWKRFRALLATARVANVPSVVSNVWVGLVVGSLAGTGEWLRDGIGASAWWLAGAGVCLYVAGNFLNDWHDREWDEMHRPERALPCGLFCPGTYLAVAVGLVVMAGLCAWAVSGLALGVAAVILVFVVVYTVLHKRTEWGVVWVGLCRALLVVLGVAAVVEEGMDAGKVAGLLHAGVMASIPLFCYIVGLSVSARHEAKRCAPGWVPGVSIMFLALPMLFAGAYGIFQMRCMYQTIGMVPYMIWMWVCHARRKDISRYVARLLAGIPLVDGMLLLPAAFCMSEQGVVVNHAIWMVPPLAFWMGLSLQRIAPAS